MDTTFTRIYALARQIPFGRVATYGQLARWAGNPRLSRVVGYAMHDAPEDVPCHRVVNRFGGLSDAFSPLGKDSHRLLLQMEGVPFLPDGNVDLAHCQWDGPGQTSDISGAITMSVTFEDIQNSPEIRTYITQADASLLALGFTEQSFAHVGRCAKVAGDLLRELGYGEHEVEVCQIAAFMHDIGNVVNRHDHAQTGAVMAFRILDKMGMEPADVAAVITAIGHHDDSTAYPVNALAAALILADKTDVRRSRVRNKEHQSFDIHDRVNYAAERSDLTLDPEQRTITLSLSINTEFCAVMDYFEIFLERMLLCRRAAEFLGLTFKLDINGLGLL